jgi:tRNA G18 (ribose-2'-O)-methylase SpoU
MAMQSTHLPRSTLCLSEGMTPRPPHPKVLKTAMGAAELVSLGEDEHQMSTLQTVLALKARGVKVYGVETTANSTTIWDTAIPDKDVAFVFGNELIGVGELLIT